MPTNDRKVNVYDKKLLSLTAVKDQFLEFLHGEINAIGSSIFGTASGTLGGFKVGLNNSGGGSTFSIDTGTGYGKRVMANQHPVDLTLITGADITTGIPFENTPGVTYYAGVHYAEVEIGIEINPRTGDPEYPALKQTFGNLGAPTSVADNSTYIRVNVNSITESGVNHAGRKVRVWLADPVSPDEAVAFYTGTIAYSSPNNYVDIPYSGAAGPLGQDTSSAPPSTTAGDYKVFIEGVTWRRNTNLSTDNTYAFLGTITGGTPPTFTTTNQPIIQIASLDIAYDGIGTPPGSGRAVTVDAGAIEFTTPSTTGDTHRAQLRMSRFSNTEDMQFMLEMILGDKRTIPIAALQARDVAVVLQVTEATTLSGAVITCTRSGVDLTHYQVRMNKKLMVVWLTGAGADSGLYAIDAFNATTLTVRKLDGSTPSFTSPTGTISIMYPRFLVAGPKPFPTSGILDWWQGLTVTLANGDLLAAPMRVLPEVGGGKITIYDASKLSGTTYYDPRELVVIDPGVVGQDGKYPIKLKRSVVVCGGNTSGSGGEEGEYDRDGVRIYNCGGDILVRDPSFPLLYDYGFPEDVPSSHTWPMIGFCPAGSLVRGHHFRDDFAYHPARWISPATAPLNYFAAVTGAGNICAKDGASDPKYGHGCCEMETGALTGNGCVLQGPQMLNINSAKDFRWTFRARLRLDNAADPEFTRAQVGLTDGTYYYYFERDALGQWHLKHWNGSTSVDTNLAVNQPQSLYQWFELAVFSGAIFWAIGTKEFTAGNNGAGMIVGPSLSGLTNCLQPFLTFTTLDNAAYKLQLDYWEWWDKETLYGRLGNSYNQNHP